MEKKHVSKKQFEFLASEILYHCDNGLLSQDQAENMLDFYEVKEGVNFVKVILVLGALLLGLGILSLIASNWTSIGKVFKLLIILVMLIATNLAGYRLLDRYPKTARSLIYLGIMIYGAGIFLVGQMFNYGGNFSEAFLLWSVGALPLAMYFRDKLIICFIDILLTIYVLDFINMERIPYLMLLIIPLLYYINRHFGSSKRITFFNNVVLLTFISEVMIRLDLDAAVIFLVLFALGVLWYHLPVKLNENIYRLQGILTFGTAGLFLTVGDVWRTLGTLYFSDIISIVFTVFYLIFLLTIIRKGRIISLVFFCLTIFRFYFDTMFDFMPKSLFFMVGGGMLLGFGYYFEKMLKKKGGSLNEK